MDNKIYVTSITMVVALLLYMRFGSLAFWVMGVTVFMSAWLIMLFETLLHMVLSEPSFQNYRRLKRKYLKEPIFEVDNSNICSEYKISETKYFFVLLFIFIGTICIIYAIV